MNRPRLTQILTSRSRSSLLIAAMLIGSSALLPATTYASDRTRPQRLTVRADVIDVQPVYQQVRRSEPRQECWVEQVRHKVTEGYSRDSVRQQRYRSQTHSNDGAAIVGGLIGGVVGNQLGRGSSQSARAGATIAGAIVGSVVANEANTGSARHRRQQSHRRHQSRPARQAPQTRYETREVERCRTVDDVRSERRLQHYDVTYSYQGRRYTTRMPRDPGSSIELNVTLSPTRR